jgi:hypothetical protein
LLIIDKEEVIKLKSKIKLLWIFSTFLLAMSASRPCLAASGERVDDSVKDIRTYTLSIVFEEINGSILEQFGSNWVFSPKKVCEINGSSLTVEGNLLKDNQTKKIRVDLEKGKSRYKVIRVSEIQ